MDKVHSLEIPSVTQNPQLACHPYANSFGTSSFYAFLHISHGLSVAVFVVIFSDAESVLYNHLSNMSSPIPKRKCHYHTHKSPPLVSVLKIKESK